MARVAKTGKKTKLATEILSDFRLACESREASLLGRKEVFMGKAKFGIFGDGKELPQIAMAKAFKNGDFRSGYYRDQTFMFAIGELTLQQYFAQLYAHTDTEADPASAGRLMNGHFATRMLDDDGNPKKYTKLKNSTADISPTAGQMPRLVGLGYASKLFRNNKDLHSFTALSDKGNEVAFGTIGNASTSEGLFLEAMNAIGVLQVPVVMSVWDDDYGISVPQEYHTTKSSISKALAGLQRTANEKGFEIFNVKAWDYEGLISVYKEATELSRKFHVPTFIHVEEATQPQGHSTSGSHERYKSEQRLEWERENDCIKRFREWILLEGLGSEEELQQIEKEAKEKAKNAKNEAWKAFNESLREDEETVTGLLKQLASESEHTRIINDIIRDLSTTVNSIRLDSVKAAKKALRITRFESTSSKQATIDWLEKSGENSLERFSSHLYSQSASSALEISITAPQYTDASKIYDGREILQACFDAAFSRDPLLIAFGEDVGKIGDVNQAFAGLQDKFGELRIADTGIREVTIIGQGIGAALRGLRPIAEIQYLDYLVYALQTLTDDLATLQYRTKGGQKAPLIIRTRGHRLEGVWHSGSPIGMLLHSLRGIYILVPRNMTQAAGFYNTMLRSDDPALIIECLNGYRLKEKMPENIGEFTVPLGEPETIRSGEDISIVTYGSMCRVVMDAAAELQKVGISCEVIDVQTLLPFDRHHAIVESLKKTNRVIFADEDVPGGASAFMMQKVLEEQNSYRYLDSKPVTISAKEHRPAYASDGDYFSKPNVEEIYDTVYEIMAESQPDKFPDLY